MENNDRQQDGGYSAPQEQQGFVEGGYDPAGGYYPEGGDDPESGYGPEGGYEPGSDYDPGFIPGGVESPLIGRVREVHEDVSDGAPEGQYEPSSVYDPGFAPESGYVPGSEYEGGYDPLFAWGGFEDDVVAEEPVDASAADPWGGGTQPLETVGRADADAGDPEIEMYSEDARQAGVDSGVDENNIEMLPDDAGEVGTDAKDGKMEEIEFTPEEAAAVPAQPDDPGDEEIEMPPMEVGLPSYMAWLKNIPGGQAEIDRYIRDAGHEQELLDAGEWGYLPLVGTALRSKYEGVFNELLGRYPELTEQLLMENLSSTQLNDSDKVRAATKELLEVRDSLESEREQILEEERERQRILEEERENKRRFEEEREQEERRLEEARQRAIQEEERPFWERLGFGDSDEDVDYPVP